MTYHLSASKLQTYQRCHRQYYFRYQRKIQSPAFFGSAPLGSALHATLARFYGDWHYLDAQPSFAWMEQCWRASREALTPEQQQEGWFILRDYYHSFVVTQRTVHRPIAVEGRIQASLPAQGVEFVITGRYDRLDALDDGLALIDYKSTKSMTLPDAQPLDVQLGLYALAIEQRYRRQLRWVSLIYLRYGEEMSFEVTDDHRDQVRDMITDLAVQLRQEEDWQPNPGSYCDRCTYARYCPAMKAKPEPLPPEAKPEPSLQLALQL